MELRQVVKQKIIAELTKIALFCIIPITLISMILTHPNNSMLETDKRCNSESKVKFYNYFEHCS